MNAKHQFKYTYNETDYEEFSPLEVTFEMPAEVNLTQMLNNFEQYLRACGFFFDGKLAIVEDGYDLPEEELEGGCMADFDKDEEESSLCDGSCGGACEEYKNEKLKEWSEGLAKLEQEIKEERDIRENVFKRADELKQMEERWKKISNEEKANILAEALDMSEDKEVKKSKWFHGICNPPSPDWKKNK